MKKLVPIGLLALLLYHMLAYVLVCLSSRWQAEHDLTERLLVYRSTDSLVEFQIPLTDTPDITSLARTTSDGFRYRDAYYSVVSLEAKNDTLYLTGLAVKNQSFWPDDLLSFLNRHIPSGGETHQKAHRFLKFLLQEYSPNPRVVFRFCVAGWHKTVRIAEVAFTLSNRAIPIHSPPPEF